LDIETFPQTCALKINQLESEISKIGSLTLTITGSISISNIHKNIKKKIVGIHQGGSIVGNNNDNSYEISPEGNFKPLIIDGSDGIDTISFLTTEGKRFYLLIKKG
jgi:hypothetical protein